MTDAPKFELQSKPCLEVDFTDGDLRTMTVAAYHHLQQERYNQPLWARGIPPVWELPTTGSGFVREFRVTDPTAYRAQMRVLLGLDSDAAAHITVCPRCGAPLEATVGRYLSGVCLDEERHVVAFETWSGNDADGFAWDLPGTRVYCADDCEVAWKPPRGVMDEGFDGATLDLTRVEADSLAELLREASEEPGQRFQFSAKRILRLLAQGDSKPGPSPEGGAA